MGPVETCEACGLEVADADAVRVELSADDLMCPTPMSFHGACYESAAPVLGAHVTDSICQVDPDHPETQRWAETSRRATSAAPVHPPQ